MASKKKGYAPIYRSLQDHWLWQSDEPFDIRSAWVDLILLANHEDKTINIGRNVFTVHAGQMWTSYVKLAQRWHWSRNRVYRYIKMLISDGMILIDATPNGTCLTIVNYKKYAIVRDTHGTTDGTPDGTSSGASDGTTDGTQTNTIKNNTKNIKSEKKEQGPAPEPPVGGGEWQ